MSKSRTGPSTARSAGFSTEEAGGQKSGMSIRVRPYADLARFFPGEGRVRVVEVPAGSTVGDLLNAHGLDESRRLTLGVNDVLASRETKLRDGDTLEVLVPMSGGMGAS